MIELKVNGQKYSGWKQASVRRSLNAFASSFELTIGDYNPACHIPLNAACSILIDGISVINGYIYGINIDYSAASHNISISGGSKTIDIVDCSAILETGQIMQGNVYSIVSELIKPYGIKLEYDAGVLSVTDFQIQTGETVSAAIERLCARFALVFTDDAEGNLIITKMSEKAASGSLINKTGREAVHNNILNASGSYSRRDRFSEYIVKSQLTGNDFVTGEDLSVEGKAVDKSISRHRPLVLLGESAINAAEAQQRAEWEKAVRTGNSAAFTYTVQDWLNSSGALWAPSQFVTIEDSNMQLSGKLLISEVTFEINESGKTCSLQIVPPESLIRQSLPRESYKGWQELRHGV